MLFKRSISPLIATILLIVVSVILITVVLTWGSSFAKDNLNKATSTVDFKESDLSSFISVTSYTQAENNNNIVIRNLHASQNLELIGYKLITDNNYIFSNQLLYFDDVITITPGEVRSLDVICFPKRDFILQLINKDLAYITLPIKINNYRSDTYCMGRDNVVVAYDMTTKIGNKLIDVSENGHDGVISGDVNYTEEGMFFELSGKVELGDPSDLNFQPNDSFSVGGLFSIDDLAFYTFPSTGTIIGRGHQPGSFGIGAQTNWNIDTETMTLLSFVIGSRAASQIPCVLTIQLNKKYHVFFVYTPGYQYTYINGSLVNTKDNSAGLSGSFYGDWGVFAPRAVPGGNARNISGFADYFLIYDRSLTSQEINKLYFLSVNPLE